MAFDWNAALNSPGAAMLSAAANNFTAANQGRAMMDPVQAYQDAIMQRAVMGQRQQQQEQMAQFRDLQMQQMQQQMAQPEARNIIKGADGFNYYEDTGERVLPGVAVPESAAGPVDRPTAKDVTGRLRYTDDGALVFPDVEVPEPVAEPVDTFDNVSKLRNEFRKETQEFQDQQASMGRVIASAQDPSAAGDLALIFNYMKVLDPGSTVREGEFATAQNAGGVDDTVRARYNQVMRGERLTTDQRADFVNRAGRMYQGAAASFESAVTEYSDLARQYEYDPDKVILRSIQYPVSAYEYLYNPDALSPEEQAELDALRAEEAGGVTP